MSRPLIRSNQCSRMCLLGGALCPIPPLWRHPNFRGDLRSCRACTQPVGNPQSTARGAGSHSLPGLACRASEWWRQLSEIPQESLLLCFGRSGSGKIPSSGARFFSFPGQAEACAAASGRAALRCRRRWPRRSAICFRSAGCSRSTTSSLEWWVRRLVVQHVLDELEAGNADRVEAQVIGAAGVASW